MSVTLYIYFKQKDSPLSKINDVLGLIRGNENIDVFKFDDRDEWIIKNDSGSLWLGIDSVSHGNNLRKSGLDPADYPYLVYLDSSTGRGKINWGLQGIIPAFFLILWDNIVVCDDLKGLFIDSKDYMDYMEKQFLTRQVKRALVHAGLFKLDNENKLII